ncbi:MAG: histidine phosphatase family protein [Leptospiraceae bacterium]|nr:histidine phosphatase family protein [Leptospiraceae bacterium]MCK6382375.1 histidine phosphatase family protein [Leptospiraceae bacterium]NUM40715.1 histidine phosphatase family protein [Leptospiraceae bacterium]
MIQHIYLIRHGETDYNREGRIQGGGINSELSDKGRIQAEMLRKRLERESLQFDYIFSSPLNRAYETAKIAASDIKQDILTDDLLKEIDCGEYEGLLTKEIDPSILQKLREDPYYKYPGGENCEDVQKRAKQFLNKLNNLEKKSALIFSHGNFNRAFMSAILDLSIEIAVKTIQHNTGLNYFQKIQSSFKLITWNDISHIDDLATWR